MSGQATLELGFRNALSPHVISDDQQKSCVAEVAQKRLRASAYPDVRDLHCEHHEGVLMLRGQVSSFYHKQLA